MHTPFCIVTCNFMLGGTKSQFVQSAVEIFINLWRFKNISCRAWQQNVLVHSAVNK